jgi:hypothetical protein
MQNTVRTITKQSEIESTITNLGVSIEGINMNRGITIIPIGVLALQPVLITGQIVYTDGENILIWSNL